MDHLVIIDMQKDYLTEKEKELLCKIELFIFEEGKNYRINFVSTKHEPDYYQNTIEYQRTKKRLCMNDTKHGFDVDKDLFEIAKATQPEHFIGNWIKEAQCVPSLGSSINREMDALSKDTVYLCGMHTDTSIVATALNFRNHMPLRKICLIENLSMAETEEKQRAAISIMRSNFIDIMKYE